MKHAVSPGFRFRDFLTIARLQSAALGILSENEAMDAIRSTRHLTE